VARLPESLCPVRLTFDSDLSRLEHAMDDFSMTASAKAGATFKTKS
jgi:hypothetical protein